MKPSAFTAALPGLSGSVLKWIAVLSMVIDHFAASILYHGIYVPAAKAGMTYAHDLYVFYRVLRGVGRLAFPIYCFLLVEGFVHTRSVKKYALRLGVFALLSEFPFDLCLYRSFWYIEKQNVFFTLLIALLAMALCETLRSSIPAQIAVCGAAMGLAYLLKTDYQWYGVLLVLFLYYLHDSRPFDLLAGVGALCWRKVEIPAIFGFALLALYNGQKGRQIKYLFYLIYPLHLLLFGVILRMMMT